MRICKKSYTKPLPEGAKKLRRKGGNVARYRDKRGRLQENKLTKSGDKILVEVKLWSIVFEDGLGIRREIKAFTNKAATQRLADRIQQLLNYKANNAPLTDELQQWIEQLPSKIRDELIEFGLLDSQTTAAAPKRFGATGYERMLFYKLAVESGLRKNELRTLKVSAFDFDELTVTVSAGCSKHRREDVLPLRKDTAKEIQSYLANKMPGAKAFSVTDKTSYMIRADLADAGIDYEDSAGRVFDFHSLRHQTGSMLAASNVHPKVAQSIMRHSDINLTMSLYTHTLRGQESEAVESLPSLTPSSQETQRATGTDDKILSKSYVQNERQGASANLKNTDNVKETPLRENNKGTVRTSNPKVAGSSPAGRVCMRIQEVVSRPQDKGQIRCGSLSGLRWAE